LRFFRDSRPVLCHTPGCVTQSSIVQGRQIGTRELDQVRHLLAGHPDWSRWRLSQEVARLWNWRNGAGQLKDMAARSLLLKLEQRGWIGLPPRRTAPVNRMRHKRVPPCALAAPQAPVKALAFNTPLRESLAELAY